MHFFFFFPTASGHAQWAHTCPTLPHGSSEKMPTTSEFSLGGAKKGCLSFLFLLPFRCSHTITRREAQECERDGDGCRNARLFSPVQDGLQFSNANWRVAAVPPCLMMRAVNAVHGIVRRKYLTKSPWRDHKVYLQNTNRAHKGLRFLPARQTKTCSFLPAIL